MKLALKLPGWLDTGGNPDPIKNNPALNIPADPSLQLANVINKFGVVALYVGGFMMFFWAVWGIFDYLIAEGNKEALAKARKKITWAIAGFIILLMAFFLSTTVQTILKPDTSKLQEIIIPK